MQSSHQPIMAGFAAALTRWPFEWAQGLLQHGSFAERRALALARQPGVDTATAWADSLRTLQASGVAAGFDIARSQYAAGVQAGMFERSLLASGEFERRLARLERLTLGPWARTV